MHLYKISVIELVNIYAINKTCKANQKQQVQVQPKKL